MGFIDLVKARTRAGRKVIVLPESMNRRTWGTARTILKEDIADLIIIGTPEDVVDYDKGLGVSGVTMINPQTYEKTQEYIDLFVELRKSKGMTPGKVKEIIMPDYAYYGCLMVRNGNADELVSDAYHSTADALRPCLQIVKTKPGTRLVSAFFFMVVPDCEYGVDGTFTLADLGLDQNPNLEELTAIAESSADSLELLVQKEARVTVLSHSTKGSARYPDVDKVVGTTRIAKEPYPELKLDEEPQLDVVLVPEVISPKAPGNEMAGRADVLMFPDLDTGNIRHRPVQRLAKAKAYGPVIQGIAKPINDLSRGYCANDIAGIVAATAVQAQTE